MDEWTGESSITHTKIKKAIFGSLFTQTKTQFE